MPVIFPFLRIVFSVALLISAECVGPASAEDVENADDVEETKMERISSTKWKPLP